MLLECTSVNNINTKDLGKYLRRVVREVNRSSKLSEIEAIANKSDAAAIIRDTADLNKSLYDGIIKKLEVHRNNANSLVIIEARRR